MMIAVGLILGLAIGALRKTKNKEHFTAYERGEK
jgi:hypothetical protein